MISGNHVNNMAVFNDIGKETLEQAHLSNQKQNQYHIQFQIFNFNKKKAFDYTMRGGKDIQELFKEAQQGNKESLFSLLDLGRREGFGSFINRKLIWPFLLGLDNQKMHDAPLYGWKNKMNSSEYEQLQKDADRSLASMKTFESITKFHLRKKQEAVLTVLDSFFAKNKQLKYIQGFHDVASIFLILFGDSNGYYLIEKAGRSYFYDFLTFDFGEVGMVISQMVNEIVTTEDPEFKRVFNNYQYTQFLTFIFPWILTWFSHNFSSVKMICRIWDYLLSTGPFGVIYFTCGIIISTKEDLLAECEQFDEPSVQTFYQEKAKSSTIDIEKAIKVAFDLEQRYQITNLKGYQRLQKKSMFRIENFNQQLGLHQAFHEHRKIWQKRERIMKKAKKAMIIVGTVAVVGILFKNHGKLSSLLSGEL